MPTTGTKVGKEKKRERKAYGVSECKVEKDETAKNKNHERNSTSTQVREDGCMTSRARTHTRTHTYTRKNKNLISAYKTRTIEMYKLSRTTMHFYQWLEALK